MSHFQDDDEDPETEERRIRENVLEGMEARPRPMKVGQSTGGRSALKGKKLSKRTPWKEDTTKPREYLSCGFPCPSCKKELPARSWGPNNRNIEVHTSEGWILISVSGDVKLPCPICLAFLQCHDKSNWHKATMEPSHLHSCLKPRPRQHWVRKHEISVRSAEGDGIKTYAKLLLCPLLHDRTPVDSTPEVSLDVV